MPKSFMGKMSQWLTNLDKKLEDDLILTKAAVHDYVDNQKEVKETLRMFEESLKYHKENHLYKKKMSEAAKLIERAEKQLAKKATSTTTSKVPEPILLKRDKSANADLRDVQNESQCEIIDGNMLTKAMYDSEEPFNFVGAGPKLNKKSTKKLDVDMSKLMLEAKVISNNSTQGRFFDS